MLNVVANDRGWGYFGDEEVKTGIQGFLVSRENGEDTVLEYITREIITTEWSPGF